MSTTAEIIVLSLALSLVVSLVTGNNLLDQECEFAQEGSVQGDPHFVGFRGQRFDFHGKPFATFNLITDAIVNVNALFIPDTRWSGKTVLGAMGIVAGRNGNRDRIFIGCDNGTLSSTLNGLDIIGEGPRVIASEGYVAATKVDNRYSIEAQVAGYLLRVRQHKTKALGCFLDVDVEYTQNWHEQLPDGILGRTARADTRIPNDAQAGDFEVRNGDLFGVDFALSRYGKGESREISMGNRKLLSSARGLLQATSCGCMDSNALNYDSFAQFSDASCLYINESSTTGNIVLFGTCTDLDTPELLSSIASSLQVPPESISIEDISCVPSTPGRRRLLGTDRVDIAFSVREEDKEVLDELVSGVRSLSLPSGYQFISIAKIAVDRDHPWRRRFRDRDTGKEDDPCASLSGPACGIGGFCIRRARRDRECMCPASAGVILGSGGICELLGSLGGGHDGAGSGSGSTSCSSSVAGWSPDSIGQLGTLCEYDVGVIYDWCSTFDAAAATAGGPSTPYENMLAHMLAARHRASCSTSRRRTLLQTDTTYPTTEEAPTTTDTGVGSRSPDPTGSSMDTADPTTGEVTGSPETADPTTGEVTGSPDTADPTTGEVTGSPDTSVGTGEPTSGVPTGSTTDVPPASDSSLDPIPSSVTPEDPFCEEYCSTFPSTPGCEACFPSLDTGSGEADTSGAADPTDPATTDPTSSGTIPSTGEYTWDSELSSSVLITEFPVTDGPTTDGSGSPPTDSSSLPPTDSSSLPPTDSSTLPPTDSSTLPPTDSSTLPPTDSSTLPPTDSSSHPPTDSSSLPPTDSSTLPPTDSSTLPPTDSSSLPPTDSSSLPPTDSSSLPDTSDISSSYPTCPSEDLGTCPTSSSSQDLPECDDAASVGEPHILMFNGTMYNLFSEGDYVYHGLMVDETGSRLIEIWQRQLFWRGTRFSASYGLMIHIRDTDLGVEHKLTIQAKRVSSSTPIQWFAANGCTGATWYKLSGSENVTITDFDGVPHVTLEANLDSGRAELTLGAGVILSLNAWDTTTTPAGISTRAYSFFDPVGFVASDGLWGTSGDPSLMGRVSLTDGYEYPDAYLDTANIFPTCVWDDHGATFDTSGTEPYPSNTTIEDICTTEEIAAANACCAAQLDDMSDDFIFNSCVFDVCALGDCSGISSSYDDTAEVPGYIFTTNYTDITTGAGTTASSSSPTTSGPGSTSTPSTTSGSAPAHSYPDNFVIISGSPVDCSADSSVCDAYGTSFCFGDGMQVVCMCTAGSEVWNESSGNCDAS